MVAKSSAFAITEINYVLIYTVFIFKKCIVFHNITVCAVLLVEKCSLGEKRFSKTFFSFTVQSQSFHKFTRRAVVVQLIDSLLKAV